MLTRSKRPRLQFDLEIEKVAPKNMKAKKDIARNHKEPYNYDYFILTIGVTDNINRSVVRVNNFKLKPALINIGLPSEESIAHLKKFLHFADTIKINVPVNVICLWIFSFSLVDRALEWLIALLHEAITTWDECTHKFLLKYFHLSKSNKKGHHEHFSEMFHMCPHHDFPIGQMVQIFYSGLSTLNQTGIDATC
ncbi:hypothetical protein CR513_13309, partial [Mucuna pruriens]